MPDETKQPAPGLNFETSEPEEGIAHIYANISHLTWTGMDLTVQLYQLDQPNRDIPALSNAPNKLLHRASITFTWPAAKTFHKMLGDILERYEKGYGPISTEFKQI
jgi:hypothetical protein